MLRTLLYCLSFLIYNFRYKYEWKTEEAQKNILRTHTTAVSARMLYKLAQQVSIMQNVLMNTNYYLVIFLFIF